MREALGSIPSMSMSFSGRNFVFARSIRKKKAFGLDFLFPPPLEGRNRGRFRGVSGTHRTAPRKEQRFLLPVLKFRPARGNFPRVFGTLRGPASVRLLVPNFPWRLRGTVAGMTRVTGAGRATGGGLGR